jgi:3-oxoacyl-[acyl-carrier-protein] synthase-3
MAQVKLEDIDAIIMATATPDNLMPATVNLVADQLGINYVATYALQSGCAGAIQAIDLGEQIIKSGKANNVLVIGGDVCNKFIDLNQDFSAMKPKEIINYILFGDGAGAILISKDSKRKGIYIDTVINILTGRNQSPGQLINWFGVRKTEEGFSTQAAIEDYKAIEKNVPILSRELMDDIFKLTGWIKDDISYFLPPQLSKIMTDKIIRYLDIPFEKTVNCVEKTGNNGNALPFIQLDSIWNTIKEGQKGIIVAIESSQWIKAGLAFHG